MGRSQAGAAGARRDAGGAQAWAGGRRVGPVTRGLHPGHPDFIQDTPTSASTRLPTLTSPRAPQLQHPPGPPEGHSPLGNMWAQDPPEVPKPPCPTHPPSRRPQSPSSLEPHPFPSAHLSPLGPALQAQGPHPVPGGLEGGPPPRKDPELLPRSQCGQGRPGGHPEVSGGRQSHRQEEVDRRCCQHQPSPRRGGRGKSPRAEGRLWREGLPRAHLSCSQGGGKS